MALDGGELGTRADGDGGWDGEKLGEADVGGVAGNEALRLPACLPIKKAATQSPIRRTGPRIARLRLLDGLIKLTYPPSPSTSSLAWATTD